MPAPAPLILGFDTSAAHCAVAVVCGDEVLAHRHEDMAKGQAENLMPLIEQILAESGYGLNDLTAIGVGIGPGNFTGIRISVSAARGLALALGVPAVGVNGFEALAFGIEGPALCTIRAPRDQVYTQMVHSAAPSAPTLSAVEAIDMPNTACVVIGEKAADIAALYGGHAQAPEHSTAVAIALVAAAKHQKGDTPRPAPLYIKPADAAPSKDTPVVILDDT